MHGNLNKLTINKEVRKKKPSIKHIFFVVHPDAFRLGNKKGNCWCSHNLPPTGGALRQRFLGSQLVTSRNPVSVVHALRLNKTWCFSHAFSNTTTSRPIHWCLEDTAFHSSYSSSSFKVYIKGLSLKPKSEGCFCVVIVNSKKVSSKKKKKKYYDKVLLGITKKIICCEFAGDLEFLYLEAEMFSSRSSFYGRPREALM